jgi:iron(II)-dependent oxidoreductase
MATSRTALRQQPFLLSRMAGARFRTDALFDLLPPNSFYDLPIAERHRLIFYLGHLEAFDWNSFSGTLNLSSHDEQFDKLFAFGIDPVVGGLPTDVPADWPTISEVERYQNSVSSKLDERFNEVLSAEPVHEPRSKL